MSLIDKLMPTQLNENGVPTIACLMPKLMFNEGIIEITCGLHAFEIWKNELFKLLIHTWWSKWVVLLWTRRWPTNKIVKISIENLIWSCIGKVTSMHWILKLPNTCVCVQEWCHKYICYYYCYYYTKQNTNIDNTFILNTNRKFGNPSKEKKNYFWLVKIITALSWNILIG